MYDSDKIITGIIVFLCLVTFPIWYFTIGGKAEYEPKHVVVAAERQCIEPAELMREKHMQILNEWREQAVRNGIKTYTASDGKVYDISLTDTCMECHSNKVEFCDRCHNYLGVTPNCWDCHNVPLSKSK